MSDKKTLELFAYASGMGGASQGSAMGPLLLQKSPFFRELSKYGIHYQWQATIQPDTNLSASKLIAVTHLCTQLANHVLPIVQQNKKFAVFGGDHTSAIGTWSAVAHTRRNQGPIGLVWIDAHMDSHTPATSPSGNFHGMPVASLLGQGEAGLTGILDKMPKIQPENLCLIGVRSFEEGEAELLKRMNVRVYFMDEVKQRGLAAILHEAIQIVSQRTSGFGVSIDIDSIDPQDAPGTGVAEPDGIFAEDLRKSLFMLAENPNLLGFEIVEFDPSRDVAQKTEKLIPQLVSAILAGK